MFEESFEIILLGNSNLNSLDILSKSYHKKDLMEVYQALTSKVKFRQKLIEIAEFVRVHQSK